MITPNDATISEYNDLMALESGQHIRVTFLLDNIVFEDADFDISNSVYLTTYMNPDIDMNFGTAFMSCIQLYFIRNDKTENLNWTREFKVEFGVEDGEDIKWVTVGFFSGNRPMWTNEEIIELTAYDRMMRFDKSANDFLSLLTYPCTLQDIYSKLCSFVGINYVSGDEIASIMSRTFSSAFNYADVETCRDILSKIAEANGCYAKITNDGKAKLIWFSDHSSDYDLIRDNIFEMHYTNLMEISGKRWQQIEDFTWTDMQNIQWGELFDNENPLIIQGITALWTNPYESYTEPPDVNSGAKRSWNELEEFKWDRLSEMTWTDAENLGWKGNICTITNNPFIHYDTEEDIRTHLLTLVNRVKLLELKYVANIVAVGNWLVEPGDIVNLEVEENTYTKYPVFSRVLSWNGYCECNYESTSNLARE